jgi:hypothetical protein
MCHYLIEYVGCDHCGGDNNFRFEIKTPSLSRESKFMNNDDYEFDLTYEIEKKRIERNIKNTRLSQSNPNYMPGKEDEENK